MIKKKYLLNQIIQTKYENKNDMKNLFLRHSGLQLLLFHKYIVILMLNCIN